MESDALLQASRRIDWRFLLPNPELGRVAYIGPARASLLESLRRFSTALTVIEPGPRPGDGEKLGLYDVVVAVAPRAAALQQVVDLLKPGGWLYLEAHGPFARRGLGLHTGRLPFARDYVATLRQLDLDEVEAYWHWPDFEHCTKILPLDDPAALLHVFPPQRSSVSGRLKSALGRWLLQSGLLAIVVPCFSLVARRGEGTRAV